MALQKARNIVVDGIKYKWMVRSGKGRLIGSSGPVLVLTAQIDTPKPGRVMQMTLQSKHWTEFHETDLDCAPIHRVSLRPSDVRQAILYAITHGWKPLEAGSKFEPIGPLDFDEYRKE